MKQLRFALASHQAGHRNPLTKAAHAVAVALMVFGALIPLSWMGTEAAGAPVTLAMVAVAALVVIGLELGTRLGTALALLVVPTLYAAHFVSELPALAGLVAAVAGVGAGIALERLAHARLEGRAPEPRHTLREFVLGPLWLAGEMLAALGLDAGRGAAVHSGVNPSSR